MGFNSAFKGLNKLCGQNVRALKGETWWHMQHPLDFTALFWRDGRKSGKD
jgi:hypothetical protein